jgi:molybdenum cofactor biosynthesis enzyme MoaA
MTSVQDVFDQLVAVNTNLTTLHNDMVAEASATNAVRQSVTQVDATLATGFTVLTQDLAVLAQLQHQQTLVLAHISHQQDAMLCELRKIAENTCRLLNEAHEQTGLQRTIASEMTALEQMYETAHPDAALERSRFVELRAEMEKCCPPPSHEPLCKYQPCPAPEPVDEQRFPTPKIPQFPGDRPKKPRADKSR